MARKNEAATDQQVFVRTPWTLKKGTEIPAELDGVELQVRRVALTDDPSEALRRVLIASGAPEDTVVSIDGEIEEPATLAHTIVDNFNSVFALAAQKDAKARVQASVKSVADADAEDIPLPTADELQAGLDEYTMDPNQRRKGGASKKERETLGKQVETIRQQKDTMDDAERAVLEKFGLL